jgi:dynactin complex subunit
MSSLVEDGNKAVLLPVFEAGQRVCDGEGFRGTVRYVGPVATSKSADAMWVGVEWDDSERGKNDGAVFTNEVETRYFTARSPRAASFVKPSKLDAGLTFTSALRSKFVDMEAPLEAPGGHLTQGSE